MTGPCLCGDPECGRCFPGARRASLPLCPSCPHPKVHHRAGRCVRAGCACVQAAPAPGPYAPVYRSVLVRDGAIEEAHLAQDPESTARLLRRYFAERTDLHGRETCVVLLLNVRRKAIGIVPISVGCLTSSLVHPREVFGPALTSGAAGIVVSHNHPSGDPEPSAEDLALTRRLAAAGALLGIEVLDHIIVGEHRHVSLHQRGVL